MGVDSSIAAMVCVMNFPESLFIWSQTSLMGVLALRCVMKFLHDSRLALRSILRACARAILKLIRFSGVGWRLALESSHFLSLTAIWQSFVHQMALFR